MNSNITYGWIDQYKKSHFNNLSNFRKNYITAEIKDILESGVGTCIEQAKIIKEFFDINGIENRLFCHRTYESEENMLDEVKMHCIVLFNYQNNWSHFEHSNQPKRGIHNYVTVDNALTEITKDFEKNDIRVLTEIPNIPEGLTFKQFNQYVNSYKKYQKESNMNK